MRALAATVTLLVLAPRASAVLRASLRDSSQGLLASDGGAYSEREAEDVIRSIYAGLHVADAEKAGFVSDEDDANFAHLYGSEAALRAEGYGEVELSGLAQLVNGKNSGGSFIDLGSGYGRSVLFACLGCGFTSCEGVELSQDRAHEADKALATAEEKVPWLGKRVRLVQGDLLADDEYFQRQVIFSNNLLFPDQVQEAMARKFERLSPPGALFITTRMLPLADGIAHMEQTTSAVTWKSEGDIFYKYTKRA